MTAYINDLPGGFSSLKHPDPRCSANNWNIKFWLTIIAAKSNQLHEKAQILTDGRGCELLYAPWRPYITPRPV